MELEVFCGSEKIVTHRFVTSRTINRRFRNKNQKEKINLIELLIKLDSFETKFFILSTIKTLVKFLE